MVRGWLKQCDKRDPQRCPKSIDSELLDALLNADRFRHGARSITSVLAMATLDKDRKLLPGNLFSHRHLLDMHVDRGPLDPDRIGGAIAFSGFSKDDKDVAPWTAVGELLLRAGARLAYAGGGTNDFAKELVKAAGERPKQLGTPFPTRLVLNDKDWEGPGLRGVEYAPVDTGGLDQLATRARRRLHIAELSVARFAMGGAVPLSKTPDGRAGVIDEVIQSLLLGQPIFLSSKAGGAAQAIGEVIGLARSRSGVVPDAFLGDEVVPDEATKARLQPPDLDPFPWTHTAQLQFLRERAIGGKRWIDNGLSIDENRALFENKDAAKIATLVTEGLTRLAERGHLTPRKPTWT